MFQIADSNLDTSADPISEDSIETEERKLDQANPDESLDSMLSRLLALQREDLDTLKAEREGEGEKTETTGPINGKKEVCVLMLA